jgi:hypothetical protein
LIHSTAFGAAELGGIPYLGFWASAQPSGALPLLALAFSLQIVPRVASTIWFGVVVVD